MSVTFPWPREMKVISELDWLECSSEGYNTWIFPMELSCALLRILTSNIFEIYFFQSKCVDVKEQTEYEALL